MLQTFLVEPEALCFRVHLCVPPSAFSCVRHSMFCLFGTGESHPIATFEGYLNVHKTVIDFRFIVQQKL